MINEPTPPRSLLRLFRDAMVQWSSGNAFVYAAALAFYTIFSIVPLLVLLVNLTFYVANAYELERGLLALLLGSAGAGHTLQLDTATTTDQILEIVRQQAGAVPAGFLAEVIEGRTPTPMTGSGALLNFFILIYGASTVFHQLLNSLNAMYGLPGTYTTLRHGILYFVISRLLSAFVVILVGIFFMILLAANVIFTTLPPTPLELFFNNLPFTPALLRFVVVPGLSILFFCMLYKYLPGGRMRWRDVLPGAVLTTLLIAVGNRVISFYLERIFGASLYGASGTVILFLVWIYYISMIILFGGKFIALYCERYGQPITPKRRLLPSRAIATAPQ